MESIEYIPKLTLPTEWIEYLHQSTLQVSKSTNWLMSILALTSSRRQICKFKMESAFSMSGLHISKFLIHISILYYHKKKKTTRKIDSAIRHTTFALIVLLPWLNILIKVAFYRITEHVFLNSMPMKYSDANQSIMLILIWFFIYILLKILKKNCWL